MADTIARAKLPYAVHYFVRGGRTRRMEIVWEDVALSFRSLTHIEAPIAYHVRGAGPKDCAQQNYSIRHFDGQYWWPVFNRQNSPRSVSAFVSGLENGDSVSWGIIKPSIAPFWDLRKATFNETFRHIRVREIVRSCRDENLAGAQHGAWQTIFCEGALYVQAGQPMYFGSNLKIKGYGRGNRSSLPRLHMSAILSKSGRGRQLPFEQSTTIGGEF